MHRSFYRIAREVQGRLGRAEYALQAASELGARLAEENRALAQSAAVRALAGRSVLHLPTVRPFHLTGFVSAPLARAAAPRKRWYEA